MTIKEAQQEVDDIREMTSQVQNKMNNLMKKGVILEVIVGSDVKSVNVPAKTTIEFEVRANFNQQL